MNRFNVVTITDSNDSLLPNILAIGINDRVITSQPSTYSKIQDTRRATNAAHCDLEGPFEFPPTPTQEQFQSCFEVPELPPRTMSLAPTNLNYYQPSHGPLEMVEVPSTHAHVHHPLPIVPPHHAHSDDAASIAASFSSTSSSGSAIRHQNLAERSRMLDAENIVRPMRYRNRSTPYIDLDKEKADSVTTRRCAGAGLASITTSGLFVTVANLGGTMPVPCSVGCIGSGILCNLGVLCCWFGAYKADLIAFGHLLPLKRDK